MHHCRSKWAGQNAVSRATATGPSVNQSFTNAEVAEDLVEYVFDIDTAGQSAKGRGRLAQFFGDQLLARSLYSTLRRRAVQGCGGFLKCATVPRPRYNRCFAKCKRVARELSQRAEQCIEPLAAFC